MPDQLSMMDALCPPPAPVPYVEPVRREVMTRAYGVETVLEFREDEPDPVEIEVRGVPCVIKFGYGFCTYAIQPAGSLFWSETGFRSFGISTDCPDTIAAMIQRYIDAPAKDGAGCGGKLVRWWPDYVRRWRDDVSWSIRWNRDEMWTQWGPERHAEVWAAHDARIVAAEARMWSEGIDPNDVDKPPHHKGSWPRFWEELA